MTDTLARQNAVYIDIGGERYHNLHDYTHYRLVRSISHGKDASTIEPSRGRMDFVVEGAMI